MLAVVLLLSIAVAGANASYVHVGRLRVPQPQNLPSIGGTPQEPADQRNQTPREVVVIYNSRAGTVAIREELWAASYWGDKLHKTGVKLGFEREHRGYFGSRYFEFETPFSAEVSGPGTYLADRLGTAGLAGAASLEGFHGEVLTEGALRGNAFEFVFASPAFRNRNWRVFEFQWNTESYGKYNFWVERVKLNGWSKAKPRREHRHRKRRKR